jgi:hypothetical protein
MLGSFYGLTAFSSSLLDISKPRMRSLISYLDNNLDSENISNYKTEITYLLKFLDENVQVDYNDPDIKKLNRQIFLIEKGASEQLLKSYSFNIENLDEEEKTEKIEQLKEEINSIVEERKIPSSVKNSFVQIATGNRISLEPLDLEILRKFKQDYYGILARYRNACTIGATSEMQVFGEPLSQIATRSPRYLLFKTINLISTGTIPITSLVKYCEEWSNIILSHIGPTAESEEIVVDIKALTTQLYSSLDFREWWKEIKGETGDNDLLELFEEKSVEFIKIMTSLINRKSFTPSKLNLFTELFKETLRLDYDLSFLQPLLSDRVEINSLEEIDTSFKRLESIGFYLGHRNNSMSFVKSLTQLSLNNKVTNFTPREDRGFTFPEVLEDIVFLTKSLVPFGTELGGKNS